MVTKTLEELGLAECRSLLAAHHFGRLAFLDHVGVLPMITPVNYAFTDAGVVLRSEQGSKFRAAVENAGAAFEIDGVDQEQQTGWSVVVRGRIASVTDPDEVERLHRLQLISWVPDSRPHYLRLAASRVTGRRVSLADLPASWWE